MYCYLFQVDKLIIPWKAILLSPPVWGIVAANFALDWAFYILLISMPIFLLDVMKTSITKVKILLFDLSFSFRYILIYEQLKSDF